MELKTLNCPWDFLARAPYDFCERQLCAWVKEPANTWSNIAFVIVGIALWRAAGQKHQVHLRWAGLVAVIAGIGSTFFHMSGSHIGGGADYFGMFLSTGLLTAYNVRRWLNCSFRSMYLLIGLTTLSLMISIVLFPNSHRYLFIFGAPCCLIELWLFFRDRHRIEYRHYLFMWGAMLIAGMFWWLDISRILCSPDNHVLSAHGLWHIFTALSFIPLYYYYCQFEELSSFFKQ